LEQRFACLYLRGTTTNDYRPRAATRNHGLSDAPTSHDVSQGYRQLFKSFASGVKRLCSIEINGFNQRLA
jgi:hypothetical protein